ncbi:MAG: acetate--CoA ligase family protein [Zoogloea sp.]|uniref:acetate--CoA ligase family protein n=1 Tax=Zoogloea sp. TaxID=49181 RepID=UPI003F3D4176
MQTQRAANLARLFNPRSIAVVGASTDPSKAGSQALRTLSGFPGQLMAVNPKAKEILGFPCYPSVAELPEGVDLAVLAIPAEFCIPAAEEAARRGVGGIFIISGGFGETGEAGAKLQAQLAEICQRTGLRLLGPNTSGFINPHAQCVASFVPGVEQLPKGRVAVVAQSGGVNLTVSFLVAQCGGGISTAVGLGNAVDISAADMLPLLADDPHTGAIALHLEGVPNGRALFDAVRYASARKPVVALVAGKNDIGEFAVSHTGNLMGSHQRTLSALQQAGAVIVERTEDLAQGAVALSHGRLPASPQPALALVTGQAGPGLLIADGLKSHGVRLPELDATTQARIQQQLPPMTFIKNPVDTGRPGPGFGEVLKAVAEADGVDALLVYSLNEPAVLDPQQVLPVARAASGKPVLFGTQGVAGEIAPTLARLNDQGVTAVASPERLVLAGQVLAADARAQWRLSQPQPTPSDPGPAPDDRPLQGAFDEDRAKALLASYGITSPRRRLCTSAQQVRETFQEINGPVVLKIAAHDVPHKTEVGGVHLNLRSEAQIDNALQAISRIPTADPGKVLIEAMAPEGVELIVGGLRDPSWGPIVVIGLGGVMAEAMGDSAVRLAPLGDGEVDEMLDSLRGKALLNGFRHLPVCHRPSIAAVVQGLSRLLADHPEIAEVEINPLRVNATSAQALDALVVLAQP